MNIEDTQMMRLKRADGSTTEGPDERMKIACDFDTGLLNEEEENNEHGEEPDCFLEVLNVHMKEMAKPAMDAPISFGKNF